MKLQLKLAIYLWVLLSSTLVFSQDFWTAISNKQIAQKQVLNRENQPLVFDTYRLDYITFKNYITSNIAKNGKAVVSFPTKGDSLSYFTIRPNAVMHPDLAAKFPEIQNYSGQDALGNHISFSLTTFGLHGQLYVNHKSSYIDPYTTDKQTYILYKKSDVDHQKSFKCDITNTLDTISKNSFEKQTTIEDPVLRTYRLAMATTVEYSAFHINRANKKNSSYQEQIETVLSALNVTVSRVNSVYERDLAIRLQLVADNDKIIFITNDSFDNNNGGTLIDQNQNVIDSTIGFSAYDIGHVVSTDGGGGLAYIASVCTNNKAKGVTGLTSPVGDTYDIDFVSHEIGHQFGAYHTFNNSCSGNISISNSYEPGSGSTIMGYAGVCPAKVTNENTDFNIQKHSDDYFHAVSIQQINEYVQTIDACSTKTALNNVAPIISGGDDYKIPHSTPFKLTAITSTNENLNYSYCWEQFDRGQDFGKPTSTSITKAAFRSFPPTDKTYRYFPEFNNIIKNISNPWEVIPTVARELNFIVTARDNNPLGSLISQDQVKITTINQGPFAVTSHNRPNTRWIFEQYQIIKWDVAGTDTNGINTTNVNIKLSTNNGESFDIMLAENVINDGTEAIIVPSITCDACRILIEPTNSIYFAVNKEPFAIVAEGSDSETFILSPNPAKEFVLFQYISNSENPIEIKIWNNLGQLVESKTYPYAKLINNVINISDLQNGIYIVQVTQGNRKITKKLVITN